MLTNQVQGTVDAYYVLLKAHYKFDNYLGFNLLFTSAMNSALDEVEMHDEMDQAKWDKKHKTRSQILRSEKTMVRLTSKDGEPDCVELKLSDPSTQIKMITPKGMIPASEARGPSGINIQEALARLAVAMPELRKHVSKSSGKEVADKHV